MGPCYDKSINVTICLKQNSRKPIKVYKSVILGFVWFEKSHQGKVYCAIFAKFYFSLLSQHTHHLNNNLLK